MRCFAYASCVAGLGFKLRVQGNVGVGTLFPCRNSRLRRRHCALPHWAIVVAMPLPIGRSPDAAGPQDDEEVVTTGVVTFATVFFMGEHSVCTTAEGLSVEELSEAMTETQQAGSSSTNELPEPMRQQQMPVTPLGGPMPPTPAAILSHHREIHMWTVQVLARKYTNAFVAQSIAKTIVSFICRTYTDVLEISTAQPPTPSPLLPSDETEEHIVR